ncbi:MAG: isocitrate/isopropylmalate family dehydrogenase [Actinomycetota bacterium]|nr:isocitrate/isopropylmalate family dehydrogenase [Actinomycetota bacterium]
MTYDLTVIPGDGVGPSVIEAAQAVIAAADVDVRWAVHDVGPAAVDRGLEAIPESALATMRATAAILKGPVTNGPRMPGAASVNVALRRDLDLYVQVRPCRTRKGVVSPFNDVDLVVIRETTEDLYAGVEFEAGSEGARTVIDAWHRTGRGELPADAGLSIKFTTAEASRRMLEFAFSYARDHGRRMVTAVHKAGVMRCTDGIFLDQARGVADRYPDLVYNECQVDDLCGRLVRRPSEFDVMVMGIAYGDIVSDVAAALVGGIGVIPGANFGDRGAMFEPAHGTAASHAGRDRVDPTAAILCAAMLLEHLGETTAARRVESALDRVIAVGDAVTYDLRSPEDRRPVVGTRAMTEQVIDAMGAM